jgi:PBP1b-binding outer membrane lipoprotein LpoB
LTGTLLAILLTALLITACAKEEDEVVEKAPGKIDQITTGMADTVVKKIKTPIDKARLTKDLGDKRLEEMDKASQSQ